MDRKLRSQVTRRRGFPPLRTRHTNGHPAAQTHSPTFAGWLPERALENHANVSSTNHVRLLTSGEIAFGRLEQAILEAKTSIHLLFYLFELDETGTRIVNLLLDRARAGLVVRVLIDGFGSSKTVRKLKAILSPVGIQVAVFLPSRFSPLSAPRFNFINHRKIVIIDERRAFCGGMNIGDEYRTLWDDLMLEIEGAAVLSLHHVLLEDWYYATQQFVSDPEPILARTHAGSTEVAVVSSGPDTEPWIHDAYFMAITRAEQRVYMVTPYFIPTPSLLMALRTASGRGVDVRLMVPAHSDVDFVKWASRSFYLSLVEAGVRIFEYDHVMVHAKALLLDEELIAVGTANMDNRSFRLNFEVSCFVRDRQLNVELLSWIEQRMNNAQEITAAYLDQKGLGRRMIESAAHLLSPLL
jgi:cardiolipin synthase A/B